MVSSCISELHLVCFALIFRIPFWLECSWCVFRLRDDLHTVSPLILHQWQVILLKLYILYILFTPSMMMSNNGVCICVHVSTGGRKTNHPALALRKMSVSFWDLWSMEGCSRRTMSSQLHLHIHLAPFFLSRLALIKLHFCSTRTEGQHVSQTGPSHTGTLA